MKHWCTGFLILFLVILLGAGTSWATDNEIRQVLQQLQREIEQLKQENALLKQQIETLQGKKIPAPKAQKASFSSKGAYGSQPSSIDFYGFFKIDAVWQDSRAVGDNYVLFVLPNSGKNHQQFTLNYRHSRFGFDFYKPYKGWSLFGKMEMDFYTHCNDEETMPWNVNHSPLRARRVFLGVDKGTWQLLAGLDWLTISQLYPHTFNFPAGTFMGNPAYRMTQVRLTKLVSLNDVSKLKIQVAAEQPFGFPRADSSYFIYDADPSNEAGFPGIEARVAYETKINGKPALLALWGHYSQEKYNTTHGGERADSYSLGLSSKIPLPITRKAFILGEIWYGNNFDGYYSCGVGQGTRFLLQDGSYVTDLKKANSKNNPILSVETIEAVGGWLELELFWTPKLVTHFGWGIDNPKNSDLAGVKNARLQQQMYYANFMYRITRAFAYGMEYMYVYCDYPNNADGKLNRVMGSLFYFF